MRGQYRKTINKTGLKNCPFCGKAMYASIVDWGENHSNVKKIVITHRAFNSHGHCVFEQLYDVVRDENELVIFLNKWNTRVEERQE